MPSPLQQQVRRVAWLIAVVAVRQRYLDELERRAPDDFPHWLSAQSLDR